MISDRGVGWLAWSRLTAQAACGPQWLGAVLYAPERIDVHCLGVTEVAAANTLGDMRDPKKLLVLQQSRALAVSVYRLTANFPASERFGLTTQMRRSAVAIDSNISEGCGRQGNREFLHSLYLVRGEASELGYLARGEASELGYQAELAEDLGFAEPEVAKAVLDSVDHLQRMLNRLATSIRTRSTKAKGASDRPPAPCES